MTTLYVKENAMEKQGMLGLQAIFFDLDNTLITTRKADEQTCIKLVDILNQKYSVPLDVASQICAKYLETFRKCPDNELMNLDLWRHLLWEQALGEKYKALAGFIYPRWLELRFEHLVLSKEIKTLLRALQKRYLLGLITNGPSGAQWEKVDKLKLKSYFNIIVVSGDQRWEKPHPQIFHEACDNLGVEPLQCIMVGDKLETDILGGITSKLGSTIWLPLASRELRVDDPIPDFIVDHVTELYTLLPKIVKVMECKRKEFSLCFNVSLSDVDDCNSNSSDGS